MFTIKSGCGNAFDVMIQRKMLISGPGVAEPIKDCKSERDRNQVLQAYYEAHGLQMQDLV